MIRKNSVKHFIIVSDDADEWSADQFHQEIMALDPELFEDYVFHGIYSYMNKDEACAISESEPCCTYAAPFRPELNLDWSAYSELIEMRGGVSGDLCLQDFDPVFDAISTSVIINSEISCEWVIPDPPDGEVLDPDKVNVEFSWGGGQSYFIGRVNSPSSCDHVEHAWYYDDPADPKMIFVCPQTCEWFKSKEDAKVVLHFGCESEVIVE